MSTQSSGQAVCPTMSSIVMLCSRRGRPENPVPAGKRVPQSVRNAGDGVQRHERAAQGRQRGMRCGGASARCGGDRGERHACRGPAGVSWTGVGVWRCWPGCDNDLQYHRCRWIRYIAWSKVCVAGLIILTLILGGPLNIRGTAYL